MTDTRAVRKAMRAIAARKGEFTLFGLFMRADALGLPDLVVAAPWLDKGTFEATTEVVELLKEHLGDRFLPRLARVQVIASKTPALQQLLAAFSVEDGEVRVERSKFFGLEMESAVVFRAKKPGSKPSGSTLQTAGGGSARGRR